MKLDFKYATQNDLPLVVATYNATVASRMVTADLEEVTVESKQNWFDAHQATTRPLWILEADGTYAGWMSFNSFYGRPAYSGTAEISIYIEQSAQGKGLGKACLLKALEEAPALGLHTLLGFIFGHNTISLNLFEAFGFERWATLPKVANMDGYMRDLIIVGIKTKHPLNLNT